MGSLVPSKFFAANSRPSIMCTWIYYNTFLILIITTRLMTLIDPWIDRWIDIDVINDNNNNNNNNSNKYTRSNDKKHLFFFNLIIAFLHFNSTYLVFNVIFNFFTILNCNDYVLNYNVTITNNYIKDIF